MAIFVKLRLLCITTYKVFLGTLNQDKPVPNLQLKVILIASLAKNFIAEGNELQALETGSQENCCHLQKGKRHYMY